MTIRYLTIKPLKRITIILIICLLHSLCTIQGLAQSKQQRTKHQDTIRVARGEILVLKDTIFIPINDTSYILPVHTTYRIEPNPEAKSEAFYDSLKVKAYKTRATKELYNLMVVKPKSPQTLNGTTVQANSAFNPHTGKHIGRVRLKNVNVIEGDPEDTLREPASKVARSASLIHVYTQDKIIRKNLFFKEGDTVNPDQISDNERILRSLGFIHDARIVIAPRQNNGDTVDVIVITQDKFEYQFEANVISPTNFDLSLMNNSVLGMGKQLGFNYLYNSGKDPNKGIIVYYKDRNLSRTFVDIDLRYSNYWSKEGTELNMKKDFLTPMTKWGGGLYVGWLSQSRDIGDYEDTTITYHYTHNFQDVWSGRSFILGRQAERRNLTLTARCYREEYITRPEVTPDSNYYFFNDILALGGLTFTRVSYLKSSMIRGFGITEDVPEGHYYSIVTGMRIGEYLTSPYLGFKFGWGNYEPGIGYLYGTVNVGAFVENQHLKQGAYDLMTAYYTPLINMNKWRFRQFVVFRLCGGINRYMNKYINLGDQVYGSSGTKGDQRMSLRLESVFFRPLSFYGFQLAFFVYGDAGFIGTGPSLEDLSYFYTSFGGGVRIRNEGLILQNLEIKLGYIPPVGAGSSKFSYGISSSDPTLFRHLGISKPDVVTFD